MLKLRLSPRVSLGLLLAAGFSLSYLAWSVSRGQARGVGPVADEGKAPEPPLPIKQVVLFNSGVGYFQREGQIEGNARIDLSFPASEINDLLKSLVLQDLGGGKVSAINYDSHDPIDKILRSFALDLTANPTFGELLNQARGEKIEVTHSDKADKKETLRKLSGRIIGMETRTRTHAAPGAPVADEAEVLNLSTEAGIQSVRLDQVVSVRFQNATLESEFQRALQVLARAHDVQKKTVSVGFDGAGKRSVRVGYVVERPIWKTSYRLRIDPGGKMVLQGWAIIENPSDEDWNDVRLVLVSGKPISYQMNLYEPLYVPRPTVEPALFASLRPPVYAPTFDGGGMLGGALPGAGGPSPSVGNFGNLGNFGNAGNIGGLNLGAGFNLGNTGGFAFMGGSVPGGFNMGMTPMNRFQLQELTKAYRDAMARVGLSKLSYDELRKRRAAHLEELAEGAKKGPAIAGLNFKEGIEAVATASEAGDYYQYLIDQKVTLARQKSALLPILDQTIEGAKVSIFNAAVHPRSPLLGLKLKNTSGQPLTQGPITVFDQSTYAGDTRILDVQPGEERLLSYALDQTTDVSTTVETTPSPQMHLKIGAGELAARYTMRQTTTYAIKNRGGVDRALIIEHPVRPDWRLSDPLKPARARGFYRFTASAPAGATVTLQVVEEREQTDQTSLGKGEQPHYATTLGITVRPAVTRFEDKVVSARIVKGVLIPRIRQRESVSYFVQNLSDVERSFAVDHLVPADWTRVATEGGTDADVRGPAAFPFKLTVPKAKTGVREIVEERFIERHVVLADISAAALREWLTLASLSGEAKAGLAKLLSLSEKAAAGRKELAELQATYDRKNKEQERMRENLKIIPMSSEHYKKFLDSFVTQEQELLALQRDITTLQAAVARQQQEQAALAASLSAE